MHEHVRFYHCSSASLRVIMIHCFGGYFIITFDYPISNVLLTNVWYVTNNVKQNKYVQNKILESSTHIVFCIYFGIYDKNESYVYFVTVTASFQVSICTIFVTFCTIRVPAKNKINVRVIIK